MITNVNHITLSAIDLEESFAFYCEVLNLKPLLKWERGAYFLAGDTWFCISEDKSFHPSKQKGHLALTTSQEFITECKESGRFKEWTINTSEGESLYILDPSGNQLELHVGSWKTRLRAIKDKPYSGKVEFFVDIDSLK